MKSSIKCIHQVDLWARCRECERMGADVALPPSTPRDNDGPGAVLEAAGLLHQRESVAVGGRAFGKSRVMNLCELAHFVLRKIEADWGETVMGIRAKEDFIDEIVQHALERGLVEPTHTGYKRKYP